MAYLIPENLASRSDIPARIGSVAAALRDQLPDDVTVWLEHTSPDRLALDLAAADAERSDFHLAVALPRHGLLLADVLEGGRRALAQREKLEIDPGRVADAARRLEEENRPALDQLGQRCIPVVAVCVAPHVPRQSAALNGRPEPPVLFSEDFSEDPTRLNAAIDELFARRGRVAEAAGGTEPVEPSSTSPALTHKAIQAALHPELVITDDRRPPEQGRLALRQMLEPDDSEIIKVLDRQQERLARWMGDGYRVVKGVAGSGKTLVLLYRARLIAKTQPRWRVLLTCFNRVLADELGRQLREMDEGLGNVTVKNIDRLPTDLYSEVHRRGGRLVLPGDDYEGRIAACLDHLRADEESALFDVVLVDESQDFDPHRLELAWRLLKPGGHFVVARDAAQNVYRRPNWIPPGTSGRGRTSILDQNYRNTEEILQTALALVEDGDGPDRAGDPETDDLIISPRSALRNGRLPELIYTSSSDEVRVACDRIEGLKTGGFGWNDIAVLCGNRQSQARYAAEFSRRGVPHLNLAYRKNRNAVGQEAADRVLVASLRLLKGLEFPIVFLSGLSEIALGGDVPDDITARRAIYVAMTRATSHLIVMVSGDEPYSRDLQGAIDRLR